eukprot:jgi/Astpho2/6080/gw1.00084.133.1_t
MDDAQLRTYLACRFYVMRLPRRGMHFHTVNHHAQVTQCLGSMQPGSWFLAVSHPTGKQPPKPEQLHAFEIPHGGFVKLERGTWHAGPLFDDLDHRDFFNLELSDTNLSD